MWWTPCIYWPFGYFLWGTVCSNLSLIFYETAYFLLLSYMNFLHIPTLSPLSNICLASVLFHLWLAYPFSQQCLLMWKISKILIQCNNFSLWFMLFSIPTLNNLCIFQGHQDQLIPKISSKSIFWVVLEGWCTLGKCGYSELFITVNIGRDTTSHLMD